MGNGTFDKFKEKNEAIKSKVDIIDSEDAQLLSQEKEDNLVELIQIITTEIRRSESQHAVLEKAINVKNSIGLIENEIGKYREEEERISKELGIFNEINAQRIFRHERLLPHLNEIKRYSTNHESLKKLKEDISSGEVELVKRRQEENQTLNSISKFIHLEVKSHNAIKALTDFGIKVSHYITNKLNADKALTHQKSKISNDLKKPTLAHFRPYETSNNIDQLNLKVCTELSHIALKSDDLIKQTNIKADKINEQKETLSVRLKAMEELKVQVKNYTENREKLITNDVESKKEFEFIEAAKPQLEEASKSKKAITSKINELRNQREKKLREKESGRG